MSWSTCGTRVACQSCIPPQRPEQDETGSSRQPRPSCAAQPAPPLAHPSYKPSIPSPKISIQLKSHSSNTNTSVLDPKQVALVTAFPLTAAIKYRRYITQNRVHAVISEFCSTQTDTSIIPSTKP